MTNRIQELTVDETWRNEQDAWNNRSNYFVEMHNRDDRKAQVTEFLSFLKDENLLPPKDGCTLDIGCGVCDYALGLAREGYKATGIDLSDGMIRGAKQLAEAEGLDLSLYIAPWSDETRRELKWDKTFDLTYSIFCPIMFDVENIRAMHGLEQARDASLAPLVALLRRRGRQRRRVGVGEAVHGAGAGKGSRISRLERANWSNRYSSAMADGPGGACSMGEDGDLS